MSRGLMGTAHLELGRIHSGADDFRHSLSSPHLPPLCPLNLCSFKMHSLWATSQTQSPRCAPFFGDDASPAPGEAGFSAAFSSRMWRTALTGSSESLLLCLCQTIFFFPVLQTGWYDCISPLKVLLTINIHIYYFWKCGKSMATAHHMPTPVMCIYFHLKK